MVTVVGNIWMSKRWWISREEDSRWLREAKFWCPIPLKDTLRGWVCYNLFPKEYYNIIAKEYGKDNYFILSSYGKENELQVERIELLENHVSSRAHADKSGGFTIHWDDSSHSCTHSSIHSIILTSRACTHSFIHTPVFFLLLVVNCTLLVMSSAPKISCHYQHTCIFPIGCCYVYMYLAWTWLLPSLDPYLNYVIVFTWIGTWLT